MPRPDTSPRLATRGIILIDNKLLLVNAWPGNQSKLWCAPGGGVEPNASLPDNLIREVHEETGLAVSVGAPVLVNEFHDPERGFHQVDIYFRCGVLAGDPLADWTDPEGVVTERCLVTRDELAALWVKPDSLGDVAWSTGDKVTYDPLELIAR